MSLSIRDMRSRAHQSLDKAVSRLYQDKGLKSPLERVNHLFGLYEQLSK